MIVIIMMHNCVNAPSGTINQTNYSTFKKRCLTYDSFLLFADILETVQTKERDNSETERE